MEVLCVMSSVSRFRERYTSPPQGGKNYLGELKRLNSDGTVHSTTIYESSFSTDPVEFHRCWDVNNGPRFRAHQRKGSTFSEGGPFLVVHAAIPRFAVAGTGLYTSRPESSTQYRYNGGFGDPVFTGDTFSESTYLAAGRLPSGVTIPTFDVTGPQAYALLKPSLEKAGLAVMLREAKDIPRMLKTTAKGFRDIYKSMGGDQSSTVIGPKKVADHFLNHSFGWVPFVSDLQRLFDVYARSHVLMGRLTSQNGKEIRRKRTIKDDEVDTLINVGYQSALWPAGLPIDTMCKNMTISGNTSKYYWEHRELIQSLVYAEGIFKYYRPEFDLSRPDSHSAVAAMQRYATLYGLRISPSNIYKATPWTWLGDWFTNAGDHVDFLNDIAIDSIASKSVYVMQRKVRKHVLRQTSNFHTGAQTFEFSRIIETKQRAPAGSPYGFNLSPSLTGRQLAILAALGISRG